MKKKCKLFGWVVSALVVAATVLSSDAASISSQWKKLGVSEMAQYGATDMLVIKSTDFSISATNTAELFSNAIPANTYVEFVSLDLVTAFTNSTTNAFTTSTALTVGDGSTANLFLESTELNVDGTEVYIRPSMTFTYGTALTNLIAAATNYGSTFLRGPAAGVLGSKLYTSAGHVVATFTPNSDEGLADCNKGEVRLYFRVRSRTGQ